MSDDSLPTLLVVDDDEAFRTTLGAALGHRGFAVTLAHDAPEAEARASETVFEYAVVDVRMPGKSGVELVARLREIDEGTRIVVLTGYGTIANAVEAMRAGAADYLTKPTTAANVHHALGGHRGNASDQSVPSLDLVEWEYIHRVVTDCGGNVSDAARRLGMHRRSLQRKLSRTPPRR